MPSGAGCKGGKPNRVRSRKSQTITKSIPLSPRLQSTQRNHDVPPAPCVTPPPSTALIDQSITPTVASPVASNTTTAELSPVAWNQTPATWNPTAAMFPEHPAPFKLVFISGNISVCQGCK